MMSKFKTIAGAVKTNFSGAKVKEKLLVIESDDWGAIRMPGKNALAQLKQAGIDLTHSQYANDGLETNSDLEALFEMLKKYKDCNGNNPIVTANTIVANPDFEKIKASGFSNYYYVELPELIEKDELSNRIIALYKQGNSEKLFRPQFHGREHLNYSRWLTDLINGNSTVLTCFEAGLTSAGNGDYAYMEAYDWSSKDDIETHKEIIKEGLNTFFGLFGYQSKSFIPPCYALDLSLEPFLKKEGITILQGTRNHLQPTGKFEQYEVIKRTFGLQTNGLFYSVRNVFFEPCITNQNNLIKNAIQQIGMAFLFNKPAVICTHRVNYTGRISEANRTYGIQQLEKLIQEVLKKWPDIKFITTEELPNKIL